MASIEENIRGAGRVKESIKNIIRRRGRW